MKASKELVERFKDALFPLDTEATREAYRKGEFPRAESVKDLDMRYRWDLFWAISRHYQDELTAACRIEGLNDNHIDTVLRQAVAPL